MGIRGHELVLHSCLYMYAASNIKMTQKKTLISLKTTCSDHHSHVIYLFDVISTLWPRSQILMELPTTYTRPGNRIYYNRMSGITEHFVWWLYIRGQLTACTLLAAVISSLLQARPEGKVHQISVIKLIYNLISVISRVGFITKTVIY